MIWDFTLQIKDLAEFDVALTDRLYEAGCSDGTLGSSHGHAHVDHGVTLRILGMYEQIRAT